MALEIKNIVKTFKGKQVLKDVSMTLETGRVYGFLGNNGAGKTTMMRIIFNMVVPDSGTISYNGVPQKDIDYTDWFYFTEKDVVPAGLSVKKYLKDIALLAHISKKEFKERMKVVNKYVKTNFRLNRKIKNLSSGQQKVVGCLALLILKPKVIFLDEPTANMDVRNQEFVLDIVKELMGPDRIIVITTHLLKEIGDSLTDVIILDKGRITYSAPKPKNKSIEDLFEEYTTAEVKDAPKKKHGKNKYHSSGLTKNEYDKIKYQVKMAKKKGIELDEEALIKEAREKNFAAEDEIAHDEVVKKEKNLERTQVNEAKLEAYLDEK